MRHHVFISYSHDDRDVAAQVERDLRERGFLCWRDPQLRCGPQFPKRLEFEISDSQAVLVLVSPSAARSAWVRREIRYAVAHRIPVMPALLNCKAIPPPLTRCLGDAKYVELGPAPSDEQIRGLVEALKRIGVGTLSDAHDADLDVVRLHSAFPALQDSPDAVDRLRVVSRVTLERFDGTPGPGLWSVHGLRHTNSVIQHLGSLAPTPMRENDAHASFCLAAAACLHDTGLVVRDVDISDEKADGSDRGAHEAAATDPGEKDVVGAVIGVRRANHHARSQDMVYRIAGEAMLTGAESRLIGDLCRYHNWFTNVQEHAASPHRRAELISLFRIANACDLGPLRAPPHFWSVFKDTIESEMSDEPSRAGRMGACSTDASAVSGFWLRNLLTKSVEVDTARREIVLTANVPSRDFAFLPRQAHEGLARAIRQLAPFAGPWRVETQIALDAEWPDILSIDTMLRFGAKICCDPEAVVSSSGDIWDYFTRAVCALADRDRAAAGGDDEAQEAKTRAALKVLDDLSRELPESRPELHALQHLSREYRAVRGRGAEKLTNLGDRMRELRDQHELYPAAPDRSAFSKIAARAFAKLDRRVKGKGVYRLFLFGYSGPVAAFVDYCVHMGKRVEIVTPLMRPLGEGPTLKVFDGLADRSGVTVEVIPDAAVPLVLQGIDGTDRPRSKCDAVLMGCEALIRPKGHRLAQRTTKVANSLGCLATAQLARMNNVPLWVLTEAGKGDPNPEVSCWVPDAKTEVGWVPVQSFMHEVGAADATREQHTELPRSEVIPADLIDAIIVA